ncbi:MAG: hypothetical protein JHC93_03995 [Parachlamydiales bacterium]|nr:hypothetical protein [Parachlamydiales bacterium]
MSLKSIINVILNSTNQDLNEAITSWGMDLKIKAHSTVLYIQTKIWQGQDCIPSTIRQSLFESRYKDPYLSYFTIDEDHNAVFLNYQGRRHGNDAVALKEFIKEFGLYSKKCHTSLKKKSSQADSCPLNT